jgi:4-amino-4-deoxy-L-arabinose transferase-like glycosyltransferase
MSSAEKRPALSASERNARLLLALITIFGLALRLWGIGWSLPDARHPLATYHPDELVNLNAALAADIPHGKFDIGFYNYGTFYFYLVSFAQTFGRGWGLIPSRPPNVSPLSAQAAGEQAALFLTGRIVTMLLGTATILVIYALGNRLFGRKVGLSAALLYALAPLAVVHAHFLTVDVPATFFVALALLWSARLLTLQTSEALTPGPSPTLRERGESKFPFPLGRGLGGRSSQGGMSTWKDYTLAGVWVGLAAATKYTASMVLIAPVVAHFLNKVPNTCRKHRGAQLIVLLCATALAFLIACPGPWLNFDAFWNGLENYPGSGVYYELFVHSREGHGDLFTATGPGWWEHFVTSSGTVGSFLSHFLPISGCWYHLVISLRYGLGVPLLLLGLAGFVLACVRRTKQDWILLSFFLLYYILTGFSAVRFARYMIPLFPVFCVWAARFVFAPFPQQAVRRLVTALGSVTVLITAFLSIVLARQMSLPDPRDRAADYLEKTAPNGASVAFAKIPWFTVPPLSPLFGALAAPTRAQAAAQTTRFQLRIPPHEWDTSVLTPPPDYVVLSNLDTMHAVSRLHEPAAVRFVQAIPADYRQWGAAPQTFGLYRNSALIPEDLLYILPTVTVYQKP